MPITKILKDAARNIDVSHWELSSAEAGQGSGRPQWKIVKRRLQGGRQQGVDVIEINSGAMEFTIVPSRGLSLWKGQVGDISLGWDSPVREIVHPDFVNLSQRNGLGWLDGFGGWVVRCGLASVGPPCMDRDQPLTLHGRVDYLPANYVECRYEPSPAPRLVVKGIVEENYPPDVRLRLETEISVEIGGTAIVLDDIVTNHGEATQEMQMLYHVNFGPPLLGKGAELIAPVKRIVPRDPRAAEESPDQWRAFHGPQGPDYTEQVYLMELQGDAEGETSAMLRTPDRASAALVTFNLRELPYFILWKNEEAGRYVTGLEPATSYPYPRPFERAGGRVPLLRGGESRHMRVRLDVLSSPDSVRIEEERIQSKVATAAAVITAPLSGG